MAVTKDQVSQALRAATAKAEDPSLSDAERASHRAAATRLSVTYRTLNADGRTTPLSDAVSQERGSYLADRAKVGFTRFLYNAMENSPLSTLTDNVFGVQATPMGASDFKTDQVRIEEAISAKAQEWFSADIANKPDSALQRLGGIAVESVAGDPIMSMIGAKGALGTAFNIATAPIPAVTGALTYDAVSGAAEAMGASPEVQDMIGKVMATGVGFASGAATGTLMGSFDKAAEARRLLGDRKKIEAQVDHAADYLASGSVRTVIEDIVSSDPNIGVKVTALRDIASVIPNFEVAPGIALYGNPIVRKNMETLLKESPTFRANVNANLADLNKAVRTRQERLFGPANQDTIQAAVRAQIGNYGVNLSNARRRVENIDSAIDTVLNRVRTSAEPIEIGQAATRLIDAKEAAVKAEVGTEYERLLNTYSAKGVTFPSESVGNLWGLVNGALDAKLFTPFPTLVNKVNALLRPKEAAPTEAPFSMTGALAGARPPQQSSTPQFRELSLEQLDSLKQELNKAMRSAYGQNTYPLLRQMKETLNAEIDKMPEFGAAYRANDRSYYERLGLPMDSAGLAQLDTLKFAETVGTYLAKPERAIDFINFTGEAGIPLVKDSILVRLRSKAFATDGSFKPDGYAKFINENRKLIDTVPGLRQELQDVGGSVRQMDALRDRLDTAHNEYAMFQADNLLKATENRGIKAAVNDMLVSPKKLDQYLKTVGNLDAEGGRVVRQGVRSSLLNRAFDSGNAKEFIETNAAVYNKWFGPTYSKDIQALANASDILRSIDTDSMSFAFSFKETDPLQRTTGTSAPQVGSLMRDRISSIAHKGSILFSRWFTQKTAGKRDEDMMRLLLDPKALGEIAAKVNGAGGSVNPQEVLKEVSKFVSAGQLRNISLIQEAAGRAAATPMPQ